MHTLDASKAERGHEGLDPGPGDLTAQWEALVTGRETFGPTLRRVREARGVSLDVVAAVTKVPASLWAAMERNDLARWPTGIYARAYMRSYAELVGLDPARVVDLFCRFFPHGDRRAEPVLRATAQLVQHDLRWADDLSAAGTPDRRAARTVSRAAPPDRRRSVRTLVIDLAVLGAVALGASLLTGWSFWVLLSLLVLLVHAAGLVQFGTSPLSGLVEREVKRLWASRPQGWSSASARR